MKRTMLSGSIICLMIVLVAVSTVYCQKTNKPKTGETVAEIPALDEFHTVIYKIWHTAWPKKDVKMLAGLLPEIQKRADVLFKAKLPGILRDKQARWKENIDKLQAVITEYKNSSSPIDTGKLLSAAEQLHSQYEKLVRTIYPVLPELEEFHVVLYQLYHYDMPVGDMKKIKSSVGALKVKMDALDKASLPERLKSKEEKFNAERKGLSISVSDLEKAMTGGDKKTVNEKIEIMHSNYQKLEKVFE